MKNPVTANTEQTADLFGVAPRTLQKWAQAGCPQASRGSWDIKAVLTWFLSNIYEPDRDDESLGEIKRRYWAQKERGEKIKNDLNEGQLVAWPDIEREWSGRIAELVNGLQCHVDRLPPLLEGKTRHEMRTIIADEVYNLRAAYARDGKYCPPPVQDGEK